MNRELPDVQAGFRKGNGTRDQIDKTLLIIEKSKRIPEKNKQTNTSISASLTTLKSLTVWITKTMENSERDGNTRPPYLPQRNLYAGQEATVSNWTWNNGLASHWERSTSRLYTATLLI